MTTIVKHKRTGNEYILLGINGEENKTNPSRFINELFSQEKTELSCSATVCDVQGNLFLAYIDDLIVIEIDGKKPADILPEPIAAKGVQAQTLPLQGRERLTEPPNNFSQTPTSEFEDEDFADEDFEEEDPERDRVIVTPPKSSDYSQDTPNQSDLDEDEQDWI